MKKTPTPTKKNALIEKYYHLDLFDADFYVIIGEYDLIRNWARDTLSIGHLEDFLPRIPPPSPARMGRQFAMMGGGSVIWIRPDVSINTLVHEVVHAATHLLESRGVPISRDNDEILAYTVERLFEKLV